MSDEKRGSGSPADPDSSLGPTLHKPPRPSEADTLARTAARFRPADHVIKEGMDTKQVVARFDAERQALALMSHPNVARVFDAGSTAQGRPFFVMEFVRGDPITTYCDRHPSPPRLGSPS